MQTPGRFRPCAKRAALFLGYTINRSPTKRAVFGIFGSTSTHAWSRCRVAAKSGSQRARRLNAKPVQAPQTPDFGESSEARIAGARLRRVEGLSSGVHSRGALATRAPRFATVCAGPWLARR